ncbi:MAG: AsmA family protein, partial [Chitinophagales bacterium]|nr:AsmA family protein [Chitinophagales bacterium]
MKKILVIAGILILLLIGTLIAVPFLFKDKINAAVKDAINENVKARVDYGDFSLSLIKSFPDFSFSLYNLSVLGIDEFKGDTLAYLPELHFTIDLMTVIKGEKYKIKKLVLEKPLIQAIVNYKGKANWDIFKSKEEKKKESETPFAAEIKKVEIKKGRIIYNDQKENILAQINNLNFTGSGDVTQDVYLFSTLTSVEELSFRSGAIKYLNRARLNAQVDMEVDSRNSKYTFKDNKIELNALALHFDGFVQTKDKIQTDLTFSAPQNTFKNILSMIPAVYLKDFDKVKTDGTFSLKGKVKGIYAEDNYPAFDLDMNIRNAMFQYPGLPASVKNISIDI